MTKEEIAARIIVLEKKLREVQLDLRELYTELNSDIVNENLAERYRHPLDSDV